MKHLRALVPVLVLTLISCSAPSTVEVPIGDAGNEDVGVFTDDSGDTLQFGPGTEIPDTWPASLPIPPGSLISVSVGEDSTVRATWLLADDQAQGVLDDYLIALQDEGFSAPVQSDLAVPDAGIFAYDMQRDDYDATVSAVIAPGESEITLLAYPRESGGA